MNQLYLSDPPAVLIADLIFTWHSKIANTKYKCHLKIYKINFDKFVVISSYLPDNLAFNITEEILTLIQLVFKTFNLKPTKTMWIKYYSIKSFNRFFKDKKIYEQLTLFQKNVYSERISKQKIKNLLKIDLE